MDKMKKQKFALFISLAIILTIYGLDRIPENSFQYLKQVLPSIFSDFDSIDLSNSLSYEKDGLEYDQANQGGEKIQIYELLEGLERKAQYYESIKKYGKASEIYIQLIGIDKFNEDYWDKIINSFEKRNMLNEVARWESLKQTVFKTSEQG